MSTISKMERRDVVPRWRLSRSVNPDLDALPANVSSDAVTSGINRSAQEILVDFDVTQKPMIAAEALSVAVAEGSDEEARLAARKLVSFDLSGRPLLASLVNEILREESQGVATVTNLDSEESARDLIRKYKLLVRAYPHSSLSWLDLAFSYSGVGQNEQAKIAVDTAVGLDRDHRGVVRASSRFYLHSGDLEKALWVIGRARDFREDPWLMSAHLATSRAAGMRSPHVSLGRRMFKDDKWRDDQISELGTALATNELEHGNRKLAAKLVERSVRAPTENAVAQVGWLETISDADFDAKSLASRVPNAWEARTFEMYEVGDWRKSCEEAACWLLDQPFSSRPAAHGSFVAATFLEDYDLSLRFSEAGFRANPKDAVVINNYAVSLAEIGRVSEARTVFDAHMRDSKHQRATSKATEGLILYREGRVEEARAAYNQAKREFVTSNDERSQLIASVFQAREELRRGNSTEASELIKPLLEVGRKHASSSDIATLEALAAKVLLEPNEKKGVRDNF